MFFLYFNESLGFWSKPYYTLDAISMRSRSGIEIGRRFGSRNQNPIQRYEKKMRNANYFTKFWQLSLIMAESVRVRWQNGEKPRLNDNLLFFSGKLPFLCFSLEKFAHSLEKFANSNIFLYFCALCVFEKIVLRLYIKF